MGVAATHHAGHAAHPQAVQRTRALAGKHMGGEHTLGVQPGQQRIVQADRGQPCLLRASKAYLHGVFMAELLELRQLCD